MGRTLVEQLAADLVAWFDRGQDGVARSVVLWIDDNHEFARLVPLLEPVLADEGVTLVVAEPSRQFALKMRLLAIERDGGRAIAYLPGFTRDDLKPSDNGRAPGLWGVYEYRYRGGVWGILPNARRWIPGDLPDPPSLIAWLRAQGVGIDAKIALPLSKDGAESLIARFAGKQAHVALDAWPRPLRLRDVRDALGGEPRDELKAIVINPGRAIAKWGTNAAQIRERLEESYGLVIGVDIDSEAIADEVVLQLALCEAWEALGKASDFPFAARLSADHAHRVALARALRNDILANEEAREAYRARIERLEQQYDLTAWALARDGTPAGLPRLSKMRWRRFLEQFDQAAERGWKIARTFVMQHADELRSTVPDRWANEANDCHWSCVADVADMCGQATLAIEEAAPMTSAASLIGAYASRWSKADALHIAIRDVCSRNLDLEHVRELADRAYCEYVATVNDRFSALVEQDGVWSFPGAAAISDVRRVVWLEEGGRRAVIISDALRWDLAVQIASGLSDASVSPVLSTLPSITPYGMTAMLPLREGEPVVKWSGGPTIKDNGGRSLAERAKRKDLIAEALGQCGMSVDFLEMTALLKSKKPPTAHVVVVFDTNIDAIGHEAPENLPASAKKLVGDIRRSIEKLHSLGVERVHVLTDHGFLLLPPDGVSALGQPSAPEPQCTKRERRWAALKPDANVDGLIRLPMPMAPDKGTLGFPRGVRTFVAPEAYMHGGISLQECVLPHLVSVGAMPTARVRPKVSVPQVKLTTGTVTFVLTPAPLAQMPLGGIEPVFVRMAIETTDSPPRRVSGERIEELRQDVPEIKGALFLESGQALQAGSTLVLRCLDRDTSEELDSVALTMAVDWD